MLPTDTVAAQPSDAKEEPMEISEIAYRAGYLDRTLAHPKQQPDVIFMRGVDIFDWYRTVAKPTRA